jgi:pimeloyl-ACP methyl ester carboxylesterase
MTATHPARRRLTVVAAAVLTVGRLNAGPAAPAATAAPAAGAPSCPGSLELALAPTLPTDKNPNGTPVTAVPAPNGKLNAVIMVHGWTGSSINQQKSVNGATSTGDFSKPITLSTNPLDHPTGDRSLIGQLQRIPGAAVYTFDYHQYSARWVTDDHLGPALAAAIDCLYRATGQKVIVVAHSLGGLVTRWAITHNTPDGTPRVREVSTVVTFGTPNLGSQLDAAANGALEAATFAPDKRVAIAATVLQAVLDTCGQVAGKQVVDPGSLCELLPTLARAFDGPAGKAMRPGSSELAALSAWPKGVTVDALAGQNVLQVEKIGWFALPWQTTGVPIGDVPVAAGAATAGATLTKVATCNYQLSPIRYSTDQVGLLIGQTSAVDVAKPLWQLASPCYHSNLMRTIELTNEAVGAVASDISGRQPIDPLTVLSKLGQQECLKNGDPMVPCNGPIPAHLSTVDGRYGYAGPAREGYGGAVFVRSSTSSADWTVAQTIGGGVNSCFGQPAPYAVLQEFDLCGDPGLPVGGPGNASSTNPQQFLDGFVTDWKAGNTAALTSYASPDVLAQFPSNPANYLAATVLWSNDCLQGSSGSGGCDVDLTPLSGSSMDYLLFYGPGSNGDGHLQIQQFTRG